MPDPLNPRLGPAALLEHILQRYPGLTREGVIEIGAMIGYDFEAPQPPKPKLKWPPNAVDQTSEHIGETLTIIGARQPPNRKIPP